MHPTTSIQSWANSLIPFYHSLVRFLSFLFSSLIWLRLQRHAAARNKLANTWKMSPPMSHIVRTILNLNNSGCKSVLLLNLLSPRHMVLNLKIKTFQTIYPIAMMAWPWCQQIGYLCENNLLLKYDFSERFLFT